MAHRFTHSITDDAFVETHVVNIAPQEVSGHLVRYLVPEQTVLLGAFVFPLNARGTVLETGPKIEAFALDRYKVQWITGAEGIAGLTSLFSSIYLMKVFGARRVFIVGTVWLAAGALGESVARTPEELFLMVLVRSCGGLFAIPSLIRLRAASVSEPSSQRLNSQPRICRVKTSISTTR